MSVPIAQVFIGNVVHTPALGNLEILEEQVILVDAHGFIAEMCPLAAPTPAALHYLHSIPASSIMRLPPTSFFSPTFIDLHLHAPQFLYLGTGLHLPLLIWLDEYAYRAEERLDSDPELARKACYGVPPACTATSRKWDRCSARIWHNKRGYQYHSCRGVSGRRTSHIRWQTHHGPIF